MSKFAAFRMFINQFIDPFLLFSYNGFPNLDMSLFTYVASAVGNLRLLNAASATPPRSPIVGRTKQERLVSSMVCELM